MPVFINIDDGEYLNTSRIQRVEFLEKAPGKEYARVHINSSYAIDYFTKEAVEAIKTYVSKNLHRDR